MTKIALNLTNCRSNKQNNDDVTNDIVDGKLPLSFYADPDYYFDDPLKYSFFNGVSMVNKTIEGNGTDFFNVKLDLEGQKPYSVTVDLKAVAEDETPTITLNLDLTNCSCNYNNGSEIEIGSELELAFETDENPEPQKTYKFVTNGSVTKMVNGTPISEDIIANNAEKLIFTTTINSGISYLKVELKADPVSDNTPVEKNTFNNVYNPTYQELNSLAKERLVKSDVGGYHIIDMGNFISELYILPFSVKTTDPDNIMLGNLKATTLAPTIAETNIRISLGKIKVDEIYNNNLDYQNNPKLLLPFLDPISLDIQDVMNETLETILNIDLTTRKTTIIVNNSKYTIYISDFEIGTEIPFLQATDNVIKKDSGFYNNEIKTPYLVLYTNEELKPAKINSLTGYQELENVKIDTNASLSEQNEILSQLQSGVYINE